MSRDGGGHRPLCPGRSAPARGLLKELLRRLAQSACPAAGLRFSWLPAASFTGLTWNGVGLSAARKRLLTTARIDGNRDGNVDHPGRLCGGPVGHAALIYGSRGWFEPPERASACHH